ncbi:MAG: Gfo/Idh/MocA family protein [Planctomycetota bacterium]|jgi:predicted dehydrogenase
MRLSDEQKAIGRENFYASIGSGVKGPNGEPPRRGILQQRIQEDLKAGRARGHGYFGYEPSIGQGGPVRVGLIGCGDVARPLIGAINKDFIRVKSVADGDQKNIAAVLGEPPEPGKSKPQKAPLLTTYGWESREQATQQIDDPVEVYTSSDELLEHAQQDGLDAVIIALPAHRHAEVAIKAMRTNVEPDENNPPRYLHALVEKPMALNVADCKEMARVAAQQQVHLAVVRQPSYNPLYENAVDLIKRGVLGEVHCIQIQSHGGELPEKAASRDRQGDDAAAQAKRLEGWQQLSAVRLLLSAMHDRGPEPLSVVAAANRPLFASGEEVNQHCYCVFEFPGVGYDADSPNNDERNRVGVQYAATVGSNFDGYAQSKHGGQGETVLGTQATLILQDEKAALLYNVRSHRLPDGTVIAATDCKVKVALGKGGKTIGLVYAEDGDREYQESAAIGRLAVEDAGRGYPQQLEHWAWCVRHNPGAEAPPEPRPLSHPEVALAEAVIVLTADLAAEKQARIEFNKEWFDLDSESTPEDDYAD